MNLEELFGFPLRLRHVYVAAAIAERGSMRDACETLFLTQPAASRTLRELEDSLGVELFERTPRGMAITPAGQELLPHLQHIVSEAGSLIRHAAEITSGERGDVRVGTLLAGSARVLPDAVIDLSDRAPDIRVSITEATPTALHEQLLVGDIDLIVGRTEPLASWPGVEVEILHDDLVNVVCASTHTCAGSTDISDLLDEPWVLPPTETSLRQQIDGAFITACGATPGNVIECVAPVPLRRMLVNGARLGVVPSGIFADDIERGDLSALRIDIDGTTVPIGIITRRGGSPTKSALRLIETLREASASGR